MTKDNQVVQCPATGCTKTFDNRKRFTKHVTENHPPEEVLNVDKESAIPTK